MAAEFLLPVLFLAVIGLIILIRRYQTFKTGNMKTDIIMLLANKNDYSDSHLQELQKQTEEIHKLVSDLSVQLNHKSKKEEDLG